MCEFSQEARVESQHKAVKAIFWLLTLVSRLLTLWDFSVRAGLRIGVFMLLAAGCGTSSDTFDLYRGQKATCEVHGQGMQVQKVDLMYGIPPKTYLAISRTRQFPRADEPHNAGYSYQGYRYGHVYICPDCEKARQEWLRKNPPATTCSGHAE